MYISFCTCVMIDEVLFFPKFEKYGRDRDRYYTFELFKNSHQKPEKIKLTVRD